MDFIAGTKWQDREADHSTPHSPEYYSTADHVHFHRIALIGDLVAAGVSVTS